MAGFAPLSPPGDAEFTPARTATFELDEGGLSLTWYIGQPCYFELNGIRLFEFDGGITNSSFTDDYTWARTQPGGVGTNIIYEVAPVNTWPDQVNSLKIYGYVSGTPYTQTRTFSIITDGFVANHTGTALSRLLSQFEGSADFRDLVSSYVNRIQEFENTAFQLLHDRNVNTASGQQLDNFGTLVNVLRGGRADEDYRLRIRAELAIILSQGTVEDLINVLRLLLGLASPPDIQIDEYYPKAIFMRPRNFIVEDDPATVAALLRRAASAATNLQFIYSQTENDDDDLFRFSDTNGTSETSSSHGYSNGTYTGAK